MAVDWLAIKTEYINGGISYRKLSEKYGVSKNAIHSRAKAENWGESKKNHLDKTWTKLGQKTAEKISDALSDAAADEATARAKLRAGLFRLAVGWVESQEKVEDTNDFRRMVQSCCDLMALEEPSKENLEYEDGLSKSLREFGEGLMGDD